LFTGFSGKKSKQFTFNTPYILCMCTAKLLSSRDTFLHFMYDGKKLKDEKARKKCLARTGQQFRGGEMGEKLRGIPNQVWLSRARICKRLWSPGIDSEESIPLVYVAWQGSTTNRVVVSGRFLGSLKGLQILAQASDSDAHCAGFSRNRQALLLTRRH
jgi:hypothetical protein